MSLMTAGRCAGLPSGSRSHRRRRPGGQAGIANSASPAWSTGLRGRSVHRAAHRHAPSGASSRSGSCGAGGRRASPTCSGCTPRQCTGCWPATGWPGWPGWTGRPAVWCAAMNAPRPASWSTSTSRSSARSPTAAAGACSAAPSATATTSATPARAPSTATRSSATTTCTPRSMTTPAWPTPRVLRRRDRRHRRRVLAARPTPGSPAAASPSKRVLTDNGSCYRSHAFAAALGTITHKRTRPYRPQTNGKVERFNRTLLEEWAYARLYRSDTERCDNFPYLAPHLQPPPRPHRTRRPTASQPRPQPLGQNN